MRSDNTFAGAVFAAVLEGVDPDELAGRFGFEDGEHFVAEFDDLLDERVPLDRARWSEELRRKIVGVLVIAKQCAHDPAGRLTQVRRAFAVIDRAETMLKRVEAPGNSLIDEVGGCSGESAQPVLDRDFRTKVLAVFDEARLVDPSVEFTRNLVVFLASDEDGVPDSAKFIPPVRDTRPVLTPSHVARTRIMLDLARQRQREGQVRGLLDPRHVDAAVLDAILDSVATELTILGFPG